MKVYSIQWLYGSTPTTGASPETNLAVNRLHFVMEALGDPAVASDAPHGGDLITLAAARGEYRYSMVRSQQRSS